MSDARHIRSDSGRTVNQRLRSWSKRAFTGVASRWVAPALAVAIGLTTSTAIAQNNPAPTTMDAATFIKTYGKDGAPPASGPDAATSQAPTVPPEERARRGIVVVQRNGQVVGLGTVLKGDGRVLTALSPLASGNGIKVLFPDGSAVPAKLGHHDRVWDLALLVPQVGKWKHGLAASGRDPLREDAKLHAFTVGAGQPTARPLELAGRKTLLGGDDAKLNGALEINNRVSPRDLGSPIIDEQGRVVAVVARGCSPSEAPKAAGAPTSCTPVAYGVPIEPMKEFLRTVPATAVAPSAWLGIQGAPESAGPAKGVRVLVVHPGSPAAEAGLKGGARDKSDTILAVAGQPVTSPQALADAIKDHAVGEEVELMIFGDGAYRTVKAKLRSSPDAPQTASAKPKPKKAVPAQLPPLPQ